MTDQIPADKVRKIVNDMRRHADHDAVRGREEEYVGQFADLLEALLPDPPRPTLADMTDEERDACTGMQADAETGERVIIIDGTERPDGRVQVLHGEIYVYLPLATEVIPRPDLPRMEWPGNQKAEGAPALPDGWRLADHPNYGLVVVTSGTPDEGGLVAFVHRDDDLHRGHGYDWCKPAELTYLDQEAEDATTNTLAVGSMWINNGALARACEESGRDQIVVLDRAGDAYVWSYGEEWWEGSVPPRFAPFTILHDGKKADQ